MSDVTPEVKPAVCDGKDHGVTADRLGQLRDEAYAFNRLLHVNESDRKGDGHDAEVESAAQDFYKFLARKPDTAYSNGDRAFLASKAFYEHLTQLPIGERRALIAFATLRNEAMTGSDAAMPILRVTMDHKAFIDDMTVKYPWPFSSDANGKTKDYFREYFTFHYRGMCAEFTKPDPHADPAPGRARPWIEIPTFKLFNWGGR